MKRTKLPNTIGYRVSEEQWNLLEKEASKEEISVHDWCRAAALEKLEKLRDETEKDGPAEATNGGGLLINAQRVFSEIAALRYLVGNAFAKMAKGEYNVDEWNNIVEEADNNAAGIAKSLLEKRRATVRAK